MLTSEFLNIAGVYCDGLNRDGVNGLLFFTDQAQNLLGYNSGQQNIVFDAATGRLPTISTEKDKFEYDAPDDVWRIIGVLNEANALSPLITDPFNSDYGYRNYTRTNDNPLERVIIGAISYYRVQNVRTFDAGDGSPARVLFTEQPGDTNGIYYLWAYGKTAKLTSDTIPLSIKPPYDIKYLLPVVMLLVRGFKDGDIVESMSKIEGLRREYQKEISKGEQGQQRSSVNRGF